MKIAYVTTYNAQDLNGFYNWAGTGYYIAKSLKQQDISLNYIGPLRDSFSLRMLSKLKRHYYQFLNQGNYLRSLDPITLKHYAGQISRKLSKVDTDIVLSATASPVAYLECEQPIVFWADATFQNLLDFYPEFKGLDQESVKHGHLMEKNVLQKCKLAIYSSEWAARTAVEYYQADASKVKVVPFGANIEDNVSTEEVESLIKSRPQSKCKLLFIGIDWFRKGGDIALKVARKLNDAGLNTELTLVGSTPFLEKDLPTFVNALGFISKSTPEGQRKICQLLADSHFLILPSLADCTPIVFCEANSLGVPCLSRRVGGIPTMIRDDLNGRLFDKDADITEYCQYILHLFSNYSEYEKLAHSSYIEYRLRLNWLAAGRSIRELLENIV
jgi:glycosyltransferase involved in cell wall biosynthesis